MGQVFLSTFVIIRAKRACAVPAAACIALRWPIGRFHASGKVQLSRIVTGKVSFKDYKDVLPIVRSPGNAYRAPHIRTKTPSELREAILGPRCVRADGNEKRNSISTGCPGGVFLGRSESHTASRGRNHARRQHSRRVHIDGDHAPARLHDSTGPPSSLACGNENHDARHGKSPSPSIGAPIHGHLDSRFRGRDRRSKSMGLDAHAVRV